LSIGVVSKNQIVITIAGVDELVACVVLKGKLRTTLDEEVIGKLCLQESREAEV
jgi:hypothetical protein